MTRVKRRVGKFIAVMLLFMLCVQSVGCGSKDGNDTQKDQKEFIYVAEYQQVEGPQWISATCSSKDALYFVGNSYDEATQVSETKIYTTDLATGETTALNKELNLGSQNANVSNMAVDSNGNLVMVISDYQMDSEDDWENAVNIYYLKVISPKDGSVLMEKDITEVLADEEQNYIQYLLVDGENNIYLSNGNTKIWSFDEQGNEKPTVELSNISWVMGMGISKEGTVLYGCYGQSSGQVEIWSVDFANRKPDKKYENLPTSLGSGNMKIIPGNEKGIFISSGNSVYEYDLETQTAVELLNWIDSDINPEGIQFFTVLEDGRLVVVTQDYSQEESKTEIVTLTQKKASEIVQKEEITLGVMYSSSDTNKAVINFNKKSDKYHITIKDYSSDDYEAGMTQFTNDIISGTGPDIFDTSSLNLSLQQLAQKGLLEDLNPYIDGDEEIKREDYFPTVLEAFSVDGKTYCIPNTFYIMTMVGKTSQVGDEPGWTLDEMMEVVKKNPDVKEIFSGATKATVLQYSIIFSMDDYVNWETGECSFDTEEFKKVLEFANIFDKDYAYSEDEPSEPVKIQNGNLLFMLTSISDVQEYQMQELIFQEPITLIGFPSNSGNGSAISGSNTFSISAKSENKEGAWEFIKSFISLEAYDENNGAWGLPTLKSAYDKYMKKAMEPDYYTDENGEEKENPKTSWGWGDFNADIYAAKQEQVDAVTALVENTNICLSWNNDLFGIISEEAEPFFEGQKSAQEVAQIIQSRVQMYVNENR